jgi:hypothetical protein
MSVTSSPFAVRNQTQFGRYREISRVCIGYICSSFYEDIEAVFGQRLMLLNSFPSVPYIPSTVIRYLEFNCFPNFIVGMLMSFSAIVHFSVGTEPISVKRYLGRLYLKMLNRQC